MRCFTFFFVTLHGQSDSLELAATGRLAICLSLESGQFTAEGNTQERPRQMILIPERDYYIIVAWAFAYYSAKAVQSHNEVISESPHAFYY